MKKCKQNRQLHLSVIDIKQAYEMPQVLVWWGLHQAQDEYFYFNQRFLLSLDGSGENRIFIKDSIIYLRGILFIQELFSEL